MPDNVLDALEKVGGVGVGLGGWVVITLILQTDRHHQTEFFCFALL